MNPLQPNFFGDNSQKNQNQQPGMFGQPTNAFGSNIPAQGINAAPFSSQQQPNLFGNSSGINTFSSQDQSKLQSMGTASASFGQPTSLFGSSNTGSQNFQPVQSFLGQQPPSANLQSFSAAQPLSNSNTLSFGSNPTSGISLNNYSATPGVSSVFGSATGNSTNLNPFTSNSISSSQPIAPQPYTASGINTAPQSFTSQPVAPQSFGTNTVPQPFNSQSTVAQPFTSATNTASQPFTSQSTVAQPFTSQSNVAPQPFTSQQSNQQPGLFSFNSVGSNQSMPSAGITKNLFDTSIKPNDSLQQNSLLTSIPKTDSNAFQSMAANNESTVQDQSIANQSTLISSIKDNSVNLYNLTLQEIIDRQTSTLEENIKVFKKDCQKVFDTDLKLIKIKNNYIETQKKIEEENARMDELFETLEYFDKYIDSLEMGDATEMGKCVDEFEKVSDKFYKSIESFKDDQDEVLDIVNENYELIDLIDSKLDSLEKFRAL